MSARTYQDWLNFMLAFLAKRMRHGNDSDAELEHRNLASHENYPIARSQFLGGASDRVVNALLEAAWPNPPVS
jgi:hypothetical protein